MKTRSWRVTFLVVMMVLMMAFAVHAGNKTLTFQWTQGAEDLPDNGGDLAKWTLYSTLDDTAAFNLWKKEGDVPYVSPPTDPFKADFTITAPDGAETSMWFKMTASDTDDNESVPSDFATPAPIVIDFRAPQPPVLSGSYDGGTKEVTVTWTQDPGDTDVVNYIIESADAPGGTYAEIGQSATSPFVYQVPATYTNKRIYFKATAVDDDGNSSAQSAELTVILAIGVPFNLEVTVKPAE